MPLYSDFPDLVPPGHTENDLLALWSEYKFAIPHLLNDAYAIGCIGFSGAVPDDKEFEGYFRKEKYSCLGFSIGLKSLNNTLLENSANIIRQKTKHFCFFDTSEVEQLIDYLK